MSMETQRFLVSKLTVSLIISVLVARFLQSTETIAKLTGMSPDQIIISTSTTITTILVDIQTKEETIQEATEDTVKLEDISTARPIMMEAGKQTRVMSDMATRTEELMLYLLESISRIEVLLWMRECPINQEITMEAIMVDKAFIDHTSKATTMKLDTSREWLTLQYIKILSSVDLMIGDRSMTSIEIHPMATLMDIPKASYTRIRSSLMQLTLSDLDATNRLQQYLIRWFDPHHEKLKT